MTRIQSDNATVLFEGWLNELGLCKGFKIAAELTLVPATYRAALYYKRLIKKMGVKRAFHLAAESLLYTGPRSQVNDTLDNANKSTLFTSSRRNQEKATYFADTYGYSLLERTPIGKAIEDFQRKTVKGKIEVISFFEYLDQKIPPQYACKVKDIRGFTQSQIDIVMGLVSAAYIFSSGGNVDTLVCGASPQKVFYLFELPALMANDKITSLNGVPKKKFLDIYNSGAKDADYQTYRLICETEIDRLGVLARTKGKNSKEWEIWEEQKELFEADGKQRRFIDVCKDIRKQKAFLPMIPYNPLGLSLSAAAFKAS